jgi:hypothetical protein
VHAHSIKDVEDMMKELESLKVGIEKAETAKTVLDEEGKRLVATAELLKGAIANYGEEKRSLNDEIRRHNAEVATHDARCTSDPNYNCNAQAAVLNERKRQGEERQKTLELKESMLDERVKDLSQATLEWSEKNKANNATLNDLHAKREQLIQKIKVDMASPWFLRDLKIRSDVSEECREMKSLEDAHRCLQRVWDGAR